MVCPKSVLHLPGLNEILKLPVFMGTSCIDEPDAHGSIIMFHFLNAAAVF